MKLFSRQRKSFFGIAGLLMLAAMLVACGNSTTTSTGGTTPTPSGPVNGKGCTQVGVLLPESASSARWESKDRPLLTAALTAAGFASNKIDITNAEGDSAKQQSQAEADLAKGDCILIVGAHDSAAAAAIVAEAKAKNVPVIAYDRLIQSKDLSYYVSFDNQKVGALQGQYIADHYKSYTSKSINTVMINGSQTDNNALLFYKGAISVLQPLYDSGALKKVYDQYTPDWNNDTARTEMDGALTANQNNIGVAYVANDGMANSVIAALKAKQLNGKVLVTGQDATVAGIQNILTGDQAMTVYKAIALEAQGAADLAKALRDGTDTASLTAGATTATSDGTAIPSILKTPVAVDKSNKQPNTPNTGFVVLGVFGLVVPAGTGGIC